MLYKKTLRLLLAFAILSSTALAQKTSDRSVPDVERLRAHINYLASDNLEGRRTGEQGAWDAAYYVGTEFNRYHLQPGWPSIMISRLGREPAASAPLFFQEFPYVA